MVGGASSTEHILWKKRNTSRREKVGQQHNESRMSNNAVWRRGLWDSTQRWGGSVLRLVRKVYGSYRWYWIANHSNSKIQNPISLMETRLNPGLHGNWKSWRKDGAHEAIVESRWSAMYNVFELLSKSHVSFGERKKVVGLSSCWSGQINHHTHGPFLARRAALQYVVYYDMREFYINMMRCRSKPQPYSSWSFWNVRMIDSYLSS